MAGVQEESRLKVSTQARGNMQIPDKTGSGPDRCNRQEAHHEWNPKTVIVFIQHLSDLFKYFQQVSETLNLCFQNSPSILLVD